MEGLRVVLFKADQEMGIKCRFISKWSQIDSYVPDKERLLFEIKRIKPDVVIIDLNLYADIDGIKTTRIIRCRFNIPVMYR